MPDAFALANAFVRIRPTDEGFKAEADALIRKDLAGLDPKVRIGASTDAAKLAVTDLSNFIGKLAGRVAEFRVRPDISTADQIALTNMYKTLLILDKRVFSSRFNLIGATAAQAQLLGIMTSLDGMQKRLDTANKAQATFLVGGAQGWANLGSKIRLFGAQAGPALLTTIGGWHLLVDVTAEILAILIPATVAMVAFGVAGFDAANKIQAQMRNIQTVVEATGQQLYPLTNGFSKIQDAVRPQVFQLFGDALSVINSRTHTFMDLATSTGNVLERLGARAAVAIQTSGFSVFLRNASKDVAGVGAIIGNLFGIIGNLVKTMPGYAQILLTILQNVTHSMEVITGSTVVQGIIRFGLAFHGAFVYIGLAATAVAIGMNRGLTALGSLLTNSAVKMRNWGILSKDASLGMQEFGSAASDAASLPWGWIAVAAAGIAFLAYKIITAKDAVMQWFAAQEQVIQQAGAVKGFTDLMTTQADVTLRLSQAHMQLADAQRHVIITSAGAGKGFSQVTTNVDAARQQIKDYSSAQTILNDQSQLYEYRLARLAVGLGGVSEAQGILLVSGIKMSQMLDKSKPAWLQILQQITGTLNAYRAMGQTQGVLGADMNALNIAASDQVTQMAKLNQAFSTVNGIISGGQTSFIAFEQAMNALPDATKKTAREMNGLSNASLTLRSNWQAAWTAATNLAAAFRNMLTLQPNSGSAPLVTKAFKDMIAQLMPLGQQTAATKAQMVALANEINPAVTNFKELTKWLGNVKNPAQDLNKIASILGVNIQDLAKDARQMSVVMQQEVVTQFDSAKLAAAGVSGAIRKLADDVVNNRVQTAAGHKDEVQLYDDLRKAGMSAKDAAALIDGLTGSIFKIPKNTKINITAHASGAGGINVSESGVINKATLESIRFAARGWKVPGYGGGDKWPAMVEGGETIVPKHLTPMIAPLMHQYHVPGFQAGGFMGLDGKIASLPGTLGSALRTAGGRALDVAMAQTVTAALGAVAGAARAQNLIGGSTALGGDEAANRALARSIFPWPAIQWPYFVDLEMREAGFNRFAQNPSSGAYGIPQALPPTKMPFAAQAAGGSHAGPQLEWMFNYIRQVYGYPANADAHEQSVHWYAKGGLVKRPKVMDAGGWVPPGLSVIHNKTGRAEHLTPGMGKLTLEIKAGHGAGRYEQFLANEIRRLVRDQGGGDVQVAFGTV